MSKFRPFIRSFSAWLLILLIVMQWVGGRVFINVVYTARIERLMNAKEELIAQKLKVELGVTAHVEIHNKEDFQIIQGMGYGAPFLFSEETDGETHYYTMDSKSPYGTRNDIKVDQPKDQEDRSAPKTLTERIFSDYCFEEQLILEFTTPASLFAETVQPLIYQDLIDLSHLSILTPPPQLA